MFHARNPLHLSCLYEPLRGSSAGTTAFLDQLRRQQQQWRRALKLRADEARQAYDLLHWCDRLSLILCRHELPEMGRELEVYHHPQQPRRRYFVSQPQGPGAPVLLRPWPFATAEVVVSVEAATLRRLQFADDAALAAALRAAPIDTLRWTLRPAPEAPARRQP